MILKFLIGNAKANLCPQPLTMLWAPALRRRQESCLLRGLQPVFYSRGRFPILKGFQSKRLDLHKFS